MLKQQQAAHAAAQKQEAIEDAQAQKQRDARNAAQLAAEKARFAQTYSFYKKYGDKITAEMDANMGKLVLLI